MPASLPTTTAIRTRAPHDAITGRDVTAYLTHPAISVMIESMSIEESGDVERRARLHATLADPARLRIVDILNLGDASPSWLQAELGMASNLLAHHVRTLERAGLVSRHRSQADRRRSYLQLLPDALGALLPRGTAGLSVPRVVFVCTANSARSQIAAALWADASSVPVTSAGTHPATRVAAGASAAARRHGLKLVGTTPQLLDDVLDARDYVITVCDNAHEELNEHAPIRSRLHWSVPDPVRVGTDAAFDDAYDEIARRVTHLAPRLTAS